MSFNQEYLANNCASKNTNHKFDGEQHFIICFFPSKEHSKISVDTSSKIIVKIWLTIQLGLYCRLQLLMFFNLKRDDIAGTCLVFHRRCISKNYVNNWTWRYRENVNLSWDIRKTTSKADNVNIVGKTLETTYATVICLKYIKKCVYFYINIILFLH